MEPRRFFELGGMWCDIADETTMSTCDAKFINYVGFLGRDYIFFVLLDALQRRRLVFGCVGSRSRN